MTWEAVPHALRTIGSWPFLSLITGALASTLTRHSRAWSVSFVCVVTLYSAFYFHDYFTRYPLRAGPWFKALEVESMKAGHRVENYPWLPKKYFEFLSAGTVKCGSEVSVLPSRLIIFSGSSTDQVGVLNG